MGMKDGSNFSSPSSRELDYEIFDKVFGLKPEPCNLEDIPHYSSDMNAAMHVVEKMKIGIPDSRVFSFALYSTMIYSSVMCGWEAWFSLSVYPPQRGDGWGFQYESPSVAICYAALEAIAGRVHTREEHEILDRNYRALIDSEIRAPGTSDPDATACSAEDWHFYHAPQLGYEPQIGEESAPDPDELYDNLPDGPGENEA